MQPTQHSQQFSRVTAKKEKKDIVETGRKVCFDGRNNDIRSIDSLILGDKLKPTVDLPRSVQREHKCIRNGKGVV